MSQRFSDGVISVLYLYDLRNSSTDDHKVESIFLIEANSERSVKCDMSKKIQVILLVICIILFYLTTILATFLVNNVFSAL